MPNRENDLRKLRYEKGLEIRYREVDLLFQRFNFFMVGMSFLVAAFAAIVASDHAEGLHIASGAIAGFGVFLSISFTLINCLAGRTISKFDDDYLKVVESKTLLHGGPFEKIRQCALADPSPDESRKRHSMVCTLFIRPYRWLDKHSRPPHTWLVPLVFFLFWAVMIYLWCRYTW